MTSASTVLPSLSHLLPTGLQFTFHIAGVPAETFSVVRFDYRSRYNELYEVDLLLSAPNTADIDLDVLLDNGAEFKVWQDGVLQGNVNGIVAFAEQGDSGFRQTFYRVKIAPQLHRLTLRRNSRIFQLKSVQDILQTLLKEHHIAAYRYLLDNERVHTRREFCVQYRETDFEFLQRLLGEEGIFFYFGQDTNGPETVVFCDKWQKLATADAVHLPYNPHRIARSTDKSLFTFKFARQLRPDYVQQKDYSFKKPNWQAAYQAEKKAQTDSESFHHLYLHYDYPGRYKDGRGQYYTQTRLDSLRRDANIGVGESHDIGIAVGRLIRLSGHPTARFNTLWQPIAVHHHGEQGQALKDEALSSEQSEGTYLHCQFEFIPRNQNYRANFPQKPQISGVQTATVTGPAGEEIFTDDQGRVKVQFHWDRDGQGDDRSSCWIRVASPWAGQGWGMLSLPRIGQEVIVSFQEGDPDQPLITGRVYNALQLPPGNLPHSKTQLHIKSKTYKGHGYNSIMFDDATHNELFSMQAERDMETLVKHDQRNTVKNHRTFDVKGSQTTTIGQGRSTTVSTGNDIKKVLSGNLIETVSLLRSTQAKDIFNYAANQIELEVGEQTSLTLDKGKILLRFGKSTILMNGEGIWLDGKHIGLQETEVAHENNTGELKAGTIFGSKVLVRDKYTGEKLTNRLCKVVFSSGETIEQETDNQGYLYIEHETQDIVAISVLFSSPKRLLTEKETRENV